MFFYQDVKYPFDFTWFIVTDTPSATISMPLHKYSSKIWDALKLKSGIYARLPKHYLKSLELKEPTPVHWRPLGVQYRLSPKTGQKERVQDVPIPIYYPPESQNGLWGGEGFVSGFRYAHNDKMSNRLPKTWKPQLFKKELYSEILDHKFTITVTPRTLDLIDAAFGFDFYILKTSKEDLNSKLGMDLKRAMLLRLAHKDTQLYPDDAVTRDKVYNKYKQFEIPEDEAEWVGLTLEEAVEKQRQLEHKEPEPQFKVCAEKLIEELHIQKLSEPHLTENK